MTTRKTVRLRERQVEERFRSRTFECQLQCYIQQPGANHREREEPRLASPLLHRKANDNNDRPYSQRDRRSDERKTSHDDRERWRRQLVDGSPCDFVKVSRVALEHFVRQPAKENQRRNGRPKA